MRLAIVVATDLGGIRPESAAGVPEVAIVTCSFASMIRFLMRETSRWMTARICCSSVRFGGSLCKKVCVRRTAPMGRLTMSSMWPEMESVSSQLPPPRSISRARLFAIRALAKHAKMNQAAFFQSGDDFYFPAGGVAHPIEESAAVLGVTQGAGGDNAHSFGGMCLVLRDESDAAPAR